VIRPETPADADAIARAVELAFGRPAEAELVAAIRASDGFVQELSLVAEEDGEIVGHLMLSYVALGDRTVLQLAPMAVVPQRQSQGVGGALVGPRWSAPTASARRSCSSWVTPTTTRASASSPPERSESSRPNPFRTRSGWRAA
jgi:predicted N-acetyltransferase YhbS